MAFQSSWSPDGEFLVSSNTINENFDLFTIQKNEANIKRIIKTKESEITPTWGSIK